MRRVNGVAASSAQLDLARQLHPRKKLENFVNVKVKNYCVDILLKNERIVVEYDSYYCHAPSIPDKRSKDMRRNKAIQDAGYKLLIVKANQCVPSETTIQNGLNRLRNTSKTSTVIRTNEWRKGGRTVNERFSYA